MLCLTDVNKAQNSYWWRSHCPLFPLFGQHKHLTFDNKKTSEDNVTFQILVTHSTQAVSPCGKQNPVLQRKEGKSEPHVNNKIKTLCSFYLAGALVHIEAGHIVLSHLLTHLGNDELSQLGSQEGFSGATGSWEDDTAVLHQQVEVPLDDGLRDECVKHQTVYTVLFNSWAEGGRKETQNKIWVKSGFCPSEQLFKK